MTTALVYARRSWLSLLAFVVAVAAIVVGVVALATMPSQGAAKAPTRTVSATPSSVGTAPVINHPIVIKRDGCQYTASFKRC